MSFFDTRI